MKNGSIILLSIKDFFTPTMLKYAIVPFVATLVIMYILFFIIAGMSVDGLSQMHLQSTQTTIQNGIPHTETVETIVEGSAIVEFLMSYAITSWIATFFIYALGGFITLYASIFITIILIGFLTPVVLRELHARHYDDVEMVGYSNIVSATLLTIRWAATMLLLFFILIPFYFIPLVNLVALNLPLYYFFHKMITYDISSTICTKEENKQIGYFSGNSIKLKTASLYLLSLIPFTIFFGAIFYVIYIGNTYFLELRKIRQEKDIS